MIVVRKKNPSTGRGTAPAAEPPESPSRHPLVALGDGLTPIEYARAILVDAGRLTTRNGVPWLDDACATPRTIMLAANRVLKGHDLPQIGKRPEWLV